MKNKFLIDTHTFIWLIDDDPKLSNTCKSLIEDIDNEIFISIASLWEMAIKISIGKLKVAGVLQQMIEELSVRNIQILPINPSHVLKVETLPFHHKDPFDRIIAAQCLVENITAISIDEILDEYQVNRVF
jgi:PIN domain nuclease of toxin-antitoxin system